MRREPVPHFTVILSKRQSIPDLKMTPDWPLSPWQPFLSPREIHLWAFSLEPDSFFEDATEILSPDEKARASKFHFRRDRDRYVTGRVRMRQLLADYLKTDAPSVTFSYTPQGKPQLESLVHGISLYFNLSHSHGLGVLAVSPLYEIGVDIEYLRLLEEEEMMARLCFSDHEQQVLNAAPSDKRGALFFKYWTRREALSKAIGVGWSGTSDTCDIRSSDLFLEKSSSSGEFPFQRGWNLIEVAPAPDVVGTVACFCKSEGATRIQCASYEISGDGIF